MPDFAVTAWIRANGAQFNSAFKGMSVAASNFGMAAKAAFERAIPGGRRLTKAFSSLAGQVAIGSLASRGIMAIGHQIKELVQSVPDFAERAEQIGRTASIIGISADSWQRLAYAAKMTDTSTEGLQTGLQRLNRNMADLTVGKGTLMDIMKFGPRGLAQAIRGTHDTTEAFMLLSDAMVKTRDPQVRARMAVAAFGKAGQEMIPMLMKGRTELTRLMLETDKYGNLLDQSTIGAGERLSESMKKMRGMFGSLKDAALSALVKALNPYAEKLTEWIRSHEDLIKQKIPEVIDKIRDAALWLWRTIERIYGTWEKLDKLANGNLARDILLVVGAWKAVRLAIDLAKGSAVAYSAITKTIGLIGGAGAAASGATTAVTTAGTGLATAAAGIGAAGLAPALGGLAILAAVYYGASQYAKNPGAANLNANNALLNAGAKGQIAASGASSYMAGMMTPALAASLNQQNQINVNVPVNVDNTSAPGVRSTVRSQPARGNPGPQFAMGTP